MDLQSSHEPEKIPFIKSLPKQTKSIDVNALYESLRTLRLNYGSFSRAIQQLDVIPEEAWAKLVRPANAPDRCLIDGCFQVIAACIDPEMANQHLYLPIGLDEITLAQWPLPDQFL